MKRICLTLLIISLFLLSVSLGAESRFSFKAVGGLHYGLYGDINNGTWGYLDYWKDLAWYYDATYQSRIKPLHFGSILAVDLLYHINNYYSFGLGLGYQRASKTKAVSINWWPDEPAQIARASSDITSFPVRLSLINYLPVNARFRLFFVAGVDVNFTQVRLTYVPAEADYTYHQKAHSIGLGLRYGPGVELKVAANIDLVIEGQGHYCRIKNFEGTLRADGDYTPYEERGHLYYFEWTSDLIPDYPISYPMVMIQATEPADDYYSNVRKARVDLSGFTIVVGVKIHL